MRQVNADKISPWCKGRFLLQLAVIKAAVGVLIATSQLLGYLAVVAHKKVPGYLTCMKQVTSIMQC